MDRLDGSIGWTSGGVDGWTGAGGRGRWLGATGRHARPSCRLATPTRPPQAGDSQGSLHPLLPLHPVSPVTSATRRARPRARRSPLPRHPPSSPSQLPTHPLILDPSEPALVVQASRMASQPLHPLHPLHLFVVQVSRMAEMEDWFTSVKAEAASERSMREMANARLQLAQVTPAQSRPLVRVHDIRYDFGYTRHLRMSKTPHPHRLASLASTVSTVSGCASLLPHAASPTVSGATRENAGATDGAAR